MRDTIRGVTTRGITWTSTLHMFLQLLTTNWDLTIYYFLNPQKHNLQSLSGQQLSHRALVTLQLATTVQPKASDLITTKATTTKRAGKTTVNDQLQALKMVGELWSNRLVAKRFLVQHLRSPCNESGHWEVSDLRVITVRLPHFWWSQSGGRKP